MNRGNRVLAVNAPLCSQELPHRKMLFQKPLRPDKGKPPGGGGIQIQPCSIYRQQEAPKLFYLRFIKTNGHPSADSLAALSVYILTIVFFLIL